MYKKLIVLAFLGIIMTVFSGCATVDLNSAKRNYENYADKTIGMTEDELLTAWGGPQSLYESADGKYRFVTYERGFEGVPSQIYKNQYDVMPGICRTVFKIENDRVVDYTAAGACYILD